MDLLEIINKRHSVRNFKNISVTYEEKELISYLSKAPKAGGINNVVISKIKERDSVLLATAFQKAIISAPTLFLVGSNDNMLYEKYDKVNALKFATHNCVIAAYSLLLYFENIGYNTCWVGGFDEELLLKKMKDYKYRPIAIIAVGVENNE